MPRRGTYRADAVRRAHEAKAARDAARKHREALIEEALADYYLSAASAARLRDAARRKAASLITDAEHAAAPDDTAAASAVARLRDLLGGITETAELCGLTVPAARDLLAAAGPGPQTGDDGTEDDGTEDDGIEDDGIGGDGNSE